MVSSFGVTYAYLKSDVSAMNKFKVGETDIKVEEPSYTPPEKIYPGLKVDKKPIVKNTGNLSCYVRMRIVFSDSRAEEFCELDWNTDNGSGWKYNDVDGYYYYINVLKPGDSTPPLFKSVKIYETKPTPSNGDPVATYTAEDIIEFDITPYAESVQAAEKKDYEDAWGIK